MATIIEPTGLEEEERLQVPVSGAHCLVVSGKLSYQLVASGVLG
jgi:hypothetical protein